MKMINSSSPFSKIKQEVIPISRVRISHFVDRVSRVNNGWHVEYLPAGKSRWWWNWRVYRRERSEESARLLADILAKEKSVTLSSYQNSEVEV